MVLPIKHLEKLQRTQNKLACTVINVGIRDHHTGDLLRELHWLPIRSRIVFKVATLCRQALSDGEPTYLASMVNYYRPTRTLRSADQSLLVQPQSRTKTAACRFSCSAPKIWNSLPQTIRKADTPAAFRTQLKTFLFARTFDAN